MVSGCASRQLNPDWTADAVKGRRVIVFIPGLYGSALAEEGTGDRFFQTFGQALWGKTPLALAGDELKIQGARRLRADGVLDKIKVIPLLISFDAYGGSFDYLKDEFGDRGTVVPFGYDWRQDDTQAVQALGRQVRSLRAAGAASIVLVGHSLGAVVAAFYLRYGEQGLEGARENWDGAKFVDGAVLAAGPYGGSMAAFHDLLHGTSVGGAETPLAAESLGSFPSFYQFVPQAESGAFVNQDFSVVKDGVFQLGNWKRWRAGLFHTAEPLDDPTRQRRESYTEQCFRLGRSFALLMQAPPKAASPRRIPLLVISGTGNPTGAKALWTGKKWIFHDDKLPDDFVKKTGSLMEDGDGLVTAASAQLPDAYARSLNVEKVSFPMEHRGVFTRSDVQKKVTDFLTRLGH